MLNTHNIQTKDVNAPIRSVLQSRGDISWVFLKKERLNLWIHKYAPYINFKLYMPRFLFSVQLIN